jgi:hypothetical protein
MWKIPGSVEILDIGAVEVLLSGFIGFVETLTRIGKRQELGLFWTHSRRTAGSAARYFFSNRLKRALCGPFSRFPFYLREVSGF